MRATKEAVEAMCVPEPNSGCWIWMGSLQEDGYGFPLVGPKRWMAHRLSYEVFVGPIPEGRQLDHKCRTRCCVNPDHLEPVTSRENTLRGIGPSARAARRITCARGHAFDIARPGGKRDCRRCRNERWLKNKRRRQAEGTWRHV